MSPGVNDGPRNTGTLPKSNRRNDRNRERSAANEIANRSTNHGRAQHSNNLFPLDWKPLGEQELPRIAKNSNTRSVSSAPSTSYQDISEFGAYSGGRQYNYSTEEFTHWQKMVPPTDSRTQSPPRLQGVKPSNVDKMPDRNQVESRLNQIRDYIRVTSTMMDSLNESNDPRAKAQNEKLSIMVEDLYDSERKLSKLLEQYQRSGIFEENGESGREDEESGEVSREMQLRKKMEESQKKLAQLQEHQANLVGMQLRMRERLNEARQAQQVLLQQDNQNAPTVALPVPANVEQLESETAALKGKLAQLQTKKKHMDYLVAELQSVEMSDRGSCSSEGSRNFGRDKSAELEAMKAQLVYLKALMEEATRVRESIDSEPEHDVDINGEAADDVEPNDEENGTNASFERQSDTDDGALGKMRNTGERPTVEEIQAVTRELREQSALLQTTRSELQRLKQASLPAIHGNPAAMFSASTSPPALPVSTTTEKKHSNNASAEAQPIQDKRRQIEDLMRKESSQASSVNRDIGGPDLNSHRSSSSQISHSSTPANIWLPPTVAGGSNEPSVDGISSSENLLDIGPQAAAAENGLNGNWCPYPAPPMNQLQHGLTEYYRQLLLGSQAQQLQMMGTTIQQCCQLLWSQQRELQSMRAAITQLQMQLRQGQGLPRPNNIETNDEYSNLSRTIHHLGETLDASLPPSTSLPNLVSLPNSSPALSHTTAVASGNSQHQQQQLNNQVPPGNRANNYWDNFRSYSRQNLLSGCVKTTTDTSLGVVANSASLANATGNSVVNSAHMKDKRNREQGTEHLPLTPLAVAEAHYSLNLQQPSNLQQQERENTVTRSNILTNEVSQQLVDNLWEEAHSSFRLPSATNDEHPLNNLSTEMREALCSVISANRRQPNYLILILQEIKAISEDHALRPLLLKSLRALQHTRSLNNPLNETADHTASESCQSSDEDSEVSAVLGIALENQSSGTEVASSSQAGASSSPTAQGPLIDHLDLPVSFSTVFASARPASSIMKPGYNEDLAEADQSRPESSNNQQQHGANEEENEEYQEEAAASHVTPQASSEADVDLEGLAAKAEDERTENAVHDNMPRLYHH